MCGGLVSGVLVAVATALGKNDKASRRAKAVELTSTGGKRECVGSKFHRVWQLV